MNIIFGVFLTVCTAVLLFTAPNEVLSSFIAGSEKAFSLTLKMAAVYGVWLGIFELIERSGLSKKVARCLKPFNRLLFGEMPEIANDYVSLNLSANFLGMSGATTPMGIKAISELEKHPNTEHAIAMFFVINATSVQLLPTSVLALRTSFNAVSPADIIFPTLLTTFLSTLIGVLLVKIFVKK